MAVWLEKKSDRAFHVCFFPKTSISGAIDPLLFRLASHLSRRLQIVPISGNEFHIRGTSGKINQDSCFCLALFSLYKGNSKPR